MKLHSPIIITPRLLPGVKIGDVFISITYDSDEADGRTRYRYYIDPLGPEEGLNDLQSGCQGGSLQEGLGSLLCFLCDAGDRYEMGTGFAVQFAPKIMEWCYENSDEISMLQCEIEETEELIKED